MRLLLFLGIVIAMTGIGTRAEAQDYPWCAQYAGGGGGVRNCGFTSFEQCMETVRGMGGFCEQNTQYIPPSAANPGQRLQQKPRAHS